MTSIKALEGNKIATLSVLCSKESVTLRDYLRSNTFSLKGGVQLLKSLTETILALHELGMVHGKLDATRVYLDWDEENKVSMFT